MNRIAAVAVVVVLFSCGAPQQQPDGGVRPASGDACSPSGGLICSADGDGVFECRGGSLISGPTLSSEMPCPAGCTTANGTVTCDMRGAREGDACPAAFSRGANTVGFCATSVSALFCVPDPEPFDGGVLNKIFSTESAHLIALACPFGCTDTTGTSCEGGGTEGLRCGSAVGTGICDAMSGDLLICTDSNVGVVFVRNECPNGCTTASDRSVSCNP